MIRRRDVLAASLTMGVAGGFPAILRAAGPALAGNPFTLGVSSGFPTHDSVVLHTRLALQPLAEDGLGGMPSTDVPLRWELARDEGFRYIVRSGEVAASSVQAHSARVVATGLDSAHDYFYRFIAAGEAHAFPVGTIDTFGTYVAPADFNETVNTLGQPLYAKQDSRKFELGTDLHTQSNPLPMCHRPGVLVKLTMS